MVMNQHLLKVKIYSTLIYSTMTTRLRIILRASPELVSTSSHVRDQANVKSASKLSKAVESDCYKYQSTDGSNYH